MSINWSMLPLLIVALIIWGAVLAYLFAVERKVVRLERKLAQLPGAKGELS